MQEEHSLWSPSSHSRRMDCLGSANAEQGLADSSSDAALEGTAMHAVRERCLREGVDVHQLIGEEVQVEGKTFVITREWDILIQPGVDRLRREVGKGELFIEHRCDLAPWLPGEHGTLDAGIVRRDLIIIDDAKFGRDPVPADTAQLKSYALAFWQHVARHKTKTRNFLLRIDQPRVFGRGDEIRLTLDDLLAHGERLTKAFIASVDPDAPRTPSPSACKYCKAAEHCREQTDFLLGLLGLTTDDLIRGGNMIPKEEQLTVEQRAAVLVHRQQIKKLIEKLEERGKAEMQQGTAYPGLKLIEGDGNREWASEEEATAFLLSKIPHKEAFKYKLLSPAQAENVLGSRNWAKAEKLITRKPGAPQIVREDDKRPALVPAVQLFDDIDDDFSPSDIDDLFN